MAILGDQSTKTSNRPVTWQIGEISRYSGSGGMPETPGCLVGVTAWKEISSGWRGKNTMVGLV